MVTKKPLATPPQAVNFGYFGGIWTKVLWIVPSATGRSRRSFLLRGATVSTALTIAYLSWVGFTTVRGIAGYASPSTERVPVAEVETRDYALRLDCHTPCLTDEELTVSARFLCSGLPNYQRIRIGPTGTDPIEMTGASWYPSAALPTESCPDSLEILVTGRSGWTDRVTVAPDAATGGRGETASRAAATWSDTPNRIWFVVIGFGLITFGSVIAWLAMVLRVLRRPGR